MVSPFEIVIQNLWDLGFFQFFIPYLLALTVFYGLLRRSQVFGKPAENVAVNAMVAAVAAFMVLGAPIILGVDYTKEFVRFFTNSVISIMVVVVGLMIASMVLPGGIGESLEKRWKGGHMAAFLVFGILIAIAVLVSSGLTNVFFPSIPTVSTDVILTVGMMIAMVIVVGLIAYVGGRGEAPKKESSGGSSS